MKKNNPNSITISVSNYMLFNKCNGKTKITGVQGGYGISATVVNTSGLN